MRRQQLGLDRVGSWWLWTGACLRSIRDYRVKMSNSLNLKAGEYSVKK